MTEEKLRSRHAFGALERVLEAISSGKVDSLDILFLKDANNKPYIGWVEKDGTPIILREEEKIVPVDVLPEVGETGKIYIYGSDGYFWNGTEFINLCRPTDVSVFETEHSKLRVELDTFKETVSDELEKKVSVAEAKAVYQSIKYEISDAPEGTLISYRENEIRVMCPKDSEFSKQSVGAGGDANSYYVTLKTYAPSDDIVGYIEHLGGQSDSEVLTDLKTDSYGRKYQPTWLAVAKYDEVTDTWNYYGNSSSSEKMIGWDYQIDWYNADGKIIASDAIRINLSNESCHFTSEPYYMNSAVKTANTYTDEQIAAITEAMAIVEF